MEILPAILGFSITGIFILTSVFSVKFPNYNENPPGILISSFVFIASGFIFETIYSYWSSIQSWTQNNSSMSFIFIILGGFLTNRFFKKLADDKEKREISVLLRNSIDSQVTSLQFINSLLFYNYNQDNTNYINIHKNNIISYKSYDTALNKIGIYDEKDIDIISKYSTELQQCLNYIERFLTEVDEDIKSQKNHINQIKYQPQYQRTWKIVKVSILTTSIFGIFTSYYLSKRYLRNNLSKLQEQFFNDYEGILFNLIQELQFIKFYKMNRILSSDLFDKLEYIRNNFIESSNNYDTCNRKPIYFYRLIIKKPIVMLERDIYTDKQKITSYIDDKEDIVVFGESPEDAKNNGENIIKYLKTQFNLEQEIQYDDIEPKIISPWG